MDDEKDIYIRPERKGRNFKRFGKKPTKMPKDGLFKATQNKKSSRRGH